MMNAQDTALAYFKAWTGQDFDLAMTYIADDVVVDAPPGRIEGAEAFRGFMGPFAQTVQDSALLAAFGDEDTAVLVYDTRTAQVPSAPGAEHVTVHNGRITHMRIIFDRLPFEVARRNG